MVLLQTTQRKFIHIRELFGTSRLACRGNKFHVSIELGTSERGLHQLGRSGRSHAHGNTRRLRLFQKCQETLARRHLGVLINQNLTQLAIQLLAIRANAPRVVVGLALVLQRQVLKLGKIIDRHVDTVAVQ